MERKVKITCTCSTFVGQIGIVTAEDHYRVRVTIGEHKNMWFGREKVEFVTE